MLVVTLVVPCGDLGSYLPSCFYSLNKKCLICTLKLVQDSIRFSSCLLPGFWIRLSEPIVHTHLAMGVFVTPTNTLILSQNAWERSRTFLDEWRTTRF